MYGVQKLIFSKCARTHNTQHTTFSRKLCVVCCVFARCEHTTHNTQKKKLCVRTVLTHNFFFCVLCVVCCAGAKCVSSSALQDPCLSEHLHRAKKGSTYSLGFTQATLALAAMCERVFWNSRAKEKNGERFRVGLVPEHEIPSQDLRGQFCPQLTSHFAHHTTHNFFRYLKKVVCCVLCVRTARTHNTQLFAISL